MLDRRSLEQGENGARARALLAGLVLLAPLWASSAFAQDRQACLSAYDAAQTHRQAGRLRAAREQLLICAKGSCPAVITSDCVPWLAEVELNLPTVIVEARDDQGRDVVAVVVTIDGETLADRADGKPVAVDPGAHQFRYVLEGYPPIAEQVVIRMAEKNRRLSVTFRRPSPPTTSGTAPTRRTTEPPGVDTGSTGTQRPVPAGVYVLGGLGLLGLGGFGYFAAQFENKVKDLEDCKPFCSKGDVDQASTQRLISFVSLGIGVVSLGVASYLYFSRSEQPLPRAATSGFVGIDVIPLQGGSQGVLRGRF